MAVHASRVLDCLPRPTGTHDDDSPALISFVITTSKIPAPTAPGPTKEQAAVPTAIHRLKIAGDIGRHIIFREERVVLWIPDHHAPAHENGRDGPKCHRC